MDPSASSHFRVHLFQRGRLHEPRCIIDSEVDSLIGQMVDYMTQIGHKSYQLATIFEALDNDIQHVDGPLDLDVVMEDEEWLEERKKMQDHLEELKKELDAYCLQLICLGELGQIRPQSGENTHCQTLGHAQRTKSVHHQEK